MREPNTIFQFLSVRRRIVITVALLVVLVAVVGLLGLIAIIDANARLHDSVTTGQTMNQAVDSARLAQVHFKKQVQEWKDILLRGNDAALFNKHFSAFENEERLVNESLRSLAIIAAEAKLNLPQLDEFIKIHGELGRHYRKALQAYRHSDLKSAVFVDSMVRGIDREPTDRIDDIVTAIKEQAKKRLTETETAARTKLEAYLAMAFVLIFLVLAAVGFGIFNKRSIIRDLPPEDKEDLEGK
jgi:methyl-accepting chemotaxis protein